MAHTIQKRGFALKPVTYCYNLIEEKAWFIPGFLRILQCKENDRNLQIKSTSCWGGLSPVGGCQTLKEYNIKMQVSMKSKKVQDLINEIVKLTAGKTLPMWKVIERSEQRRDAIWEDIFHEEINKMKGNK